MWEEFYDSLVPSYSTQIINNFEEVGHFSWNLMTILASGLDVNLNKLHKGFDYITEDGVKDRGLLLVLEENNCKPIFDVPGICFALNSCNDVVRSFSLGFT